MFAEEQRILLKAIIHHAPLTPRSTQSTGLFKQASEFTGTFSRKTEKQKATLLSLRVGVLALVLCVLVGAAAAYPLVARGLVWVWFPLLFF